MSVVTLKVPEDKTTLNTALHLHHEMISVSLQQQQQPASRDTDRQTRQQTDDETTTSS